MGDSLVATDLQGILRQHSAYHERLANGEFDNTPETFDDLLATEHLRPLVAIVGAKGVGDLLHVVHELVIQVLRDGASDEDQEYLGDALARVMEWGMAVAMVGRF